MAKPIAWQNPEEYPWQNPWNYTRLNHMAKAIGISMAKAMEPKIVLLDVGWRQRQYTF